MAEDEPKLKIPLEDHKDHVFDFIYVVILKNVVFLQESLYSFMYF